MANSFYEDYLQRSGRLFEPTGILNSPVDTANSLDRLVNVSSPEATWKQIFQDIASGKGLQNVIDSMQPFFSGLGNNIAVAAKNISDGLAPMLDTFMQQFSSATDKANLIARQNARDLNEFNATQAQLERDWQERMANTAYQRQVADMRAAGLNPILAYGSAAGAPVPSGASASGTAAQTFRADDKSDTIMMFIMLAKALLGGLTRAGKS